ncbi:MAG: hypothetical protein ACYDA3_09590 [Gaiellaceae bacterium]
MAMLGATASAGSGELEQQRQLPGLAPRSRRRERALSFLARPLPPSFELRVITIEPGAERAYDDADRRDALVLVERGAIGGRAV